MGATGRRQKVITGHKTAAARRQLGPLLCPTGHLARRFSGPCTSPGLAAACCERYPCCPTQPSAALCVTPQPGHPKARAIGS